MSSPKVDRPARGKAGGIARRKPGKHDGGRHPADLLLRVEEQEKALRALRLRVRKLSKTNRAKDEFLATLGHELRTPLGPIRFAAELLRLKSNGHDELGDSIDRQVDALARLIDRIDDLSRGSPAPDGALSSPIRAVDLASVKTPIFDVSPPFQAHANTQKKGPFLDGQDERATQIPQRVVAVDDNRDAAEALAEMMRLWGHEVRVACDAGAAMRAAAELHPDLMMLDLDLPLVSGYQLARRIRKESWGAATKLIAVSGWDGESNERRLKKAGFDGHLLKPIDVESLRTTLTNLGPAANPRRG